MTPPDSVRAEAEADFRSTKPANDQDAATSPAVPAKRDSIPPIKVLTLQDLLCYPFPEPEIILAPWLTTQSLTMIHAWRGVGKTHVALNVAMAVASGGSFLGWSAPKARSVLYLDGEMPGSAMRKRALGILAERSPSVIGNLLRIVTPDAQQGAMPDLVTQAGQAAVEAAALEAEVIIVDNISTLCRATGPENEAESWRAPQEWALRMRRQGKSVVFIHHSGKGGGQRGSSKREDTLDVVIHLRKPEDYTPDQGARFQVHFEKFRHGFGEEARPFEARLTTGARGGATWSWDYLKSPDNEEMLKLLAAGHTQDEVAKSLGVHKSTVSRAAKKARETGQLQPKAKGGRNAVAAPPEPDTTAHGA